MIRANSGLTGKSIPCRSGFEGGADGWFRYPLPISTEKGMKMKRIFVIGIVGIFAGLIIVAGCGPSTPSATSTVTQSQTPAPEVKKEPVLYTGKSCLSQMAGLAARWSADALPYHMESEINAESDGHDGKATVWTAMFAAPSRRTYRVFTCSGSRLPQAPPLGASPSTPETAVSPDVAKMLFQQFQLNSDSDQAYTLAQEKGGAKLMEKDAKLPVAYFLDWDLKNKQLIWVVVYGESGKTKGKGVVDATSGKFLRAG